MIKSFRSKALEQLYEGKPKGVNANHRERLEEILAVLDVAEAVADADIAGWKLHPLKGDRQGEWSVKVSGNWRVTFRMDGSDVTDVDYEDYH